MDFKTAYLQAIECEGFHVDSAQASAVEQLDAVYKNLLINKNHKTAFQRVWSVFVDNQDHANRMQGCYLWGGVGRGKTWLMDLFYQSIPFKEKSRLHFHEFMQQIHLRLKKIGGRRDPLVTIAEDIAADNKIICLDEFHVSDITDAMLLYGLMDALYKNGAIMLMTSNIHPDELYKNGLQRSRFLPAIDLIKKRCLVLQVSGVQDFRLSRSEKNLNYITPLSLDTDAQLEKRFLDLAKGNVVYEGTVHINNRFVTQEMMASNIIWFDFQELCGGPRAASDYLCLADTYEYVIVSNIFRMDESHDDMARRFINLVDALYDRQVGLIISATGNPTELYSGIRFEQEFKRTSSRLEEIRTRVYPQRDLSVLQDRNSFLSG